MKLVEEEEEGKEREGTVVAKSSTPSVLASAEEGSFVGRADTVGARIGAAGVRWRIEEEGRRTSSTRWHD